MTDRSVWVHAGLLAAAGAASAYLWSHDRGAKAATAADVTVWPGRADDVREVIYEQAGWKTVRLESRRDAQGRYFAGKVQWTGKAEAADGGVPDAATRGGSGPWEAFVSVKAAERVAGAFAPFKAVRDVGRIDPARAAEFGFKEPADTVDVTAGGAEHRLEVGGATPGGGYRYVRDEATGSVYAIGAEALRDLEEGETLLPERELHDERFPEVTAARIVIDGRTRELVRSEVNGRRVWSDPPTQDKADPTASDWLTKIDALRPARYVGDLPPTAHPLARVEYALGRDRSAFFVELAKAPKKGAPPDYFIRTERTRMWATVLVSWGEQVEEELRAIGR